MSFYPFSILNLILLVPVYLIGALFLAWGVRHVRARHPDNWKVLIPISLLVYAGPISEELWIAGNFAYLCRKDAGLFVYKTVAVEGFYDAARPTHAGPRSKQAADELDAGGYRFYEMVFRGGRGKADRVVHLEKNDGEWTATLLDHPIARYHYFRDSGVDIGHKLMKQESRVIDSETDEAIAQYRVYVREAPWFFIGLDRPNMGCDSPEGGPYSKHPNSFLIYRDVLTPTHGSVGATR